MTVARLYRGVSIAIHEAGGGLLPRGKVSMPVRTWGDGGRWGDGGTWGPSEVNGVIEHQREQMSFAGSAYISTTPDLGRAKAYALYSAADGVVYVIDVALLDRHGVKCFRVNEKVKLDVAMPEDDEHALLTEPPGSALPDAVVIEVVRVQR